MFPEKVIASCNGGRLKILQSKLTGKPIVHGVIPPADAECEEEDSDAEVDEETIEDEDELFSLATETLKGVDDEEAP